MTDTRKRKWSELAYCRHQSANTRVYLSLVLCTRTLGVGMLRTERYSYPQLIPTKGQFWPILLIWCMRLIWHLRTVTQYCFCIFWTFNNQVQGWENWGVKNFKGVLWYGDTCKTLACCAAGPGSIPRQGVSCARLGGLSSPSLDCLYLSPGLYSLVPHLSQLSCLSSRKAKKRKITK